MFYNNNATHIRREILVRIASMAYEGTIKEKIDRLPLEMAPKGKQSFRCCVHHDRAVIKYRTMASLGMAVEEETDELRPLSSYAEEAGLRTGVENPVLTVIDEACSSCVKSHYFATNVCRGCVARPCMMNCPKNAISMVKGQAKIDPDTCVNCGLCQKVCPYHAIVKVPVPCEEACPVGAISKDENGKEKIDFSKCIFCGKCMSECPFGAVVERSQIVDVIKAIKDGKDVVAVLAPAVAGQFPANLERIFAAVRQVGFSDVVEVAKGADITIANEAQELLERVKEGAPFMTTSCCPAYTECAEKHVPALRPFISHTKSPMYYSAEMVKKLRPEAVVVFIGPCVAKKNEAMKTKLVDFVLNAEDLGALFLAKEIDVIACEPESLTDIPTPDGRGFAVSGGVAHAVAAEIERKGGSLKVEPVLVDGLDSKAVKQLKLFAAGKAGGNLVEVMTCQGGCVAGPAVISKPAVAAKKIADLAKPVPAGV